MNINNNQFLSIEQLKDQYFTDSKPKTQTSGVGSFKDIFDRINEESQGSELKFSKHAISRLSTREITLDNTQMDSLKSGLEKANTKGIRESLMIMDDLAFIVNVPNSTVITAMDSTNSNEQVFTNIDGAVIV